MTRRHFALAAAVAFTAFTAFAQRSSMTPNQGTNRTGAPGLENAASNIKEWARLRAADGMRVCRFQAVLNAFMQVDNAMDPMQPNVSASKAADLLAAAGRMVPADNDPVSFQLRSLMITAKQIFDPHASPNIPAQRERFHREVLEPAARLVAPEVIAFVERAQQLDVALRAVSQAQSDMSALIVHAIHGDCGTAGRDSHFE
jgi:hypothetical protein